MTEIQFEIPLASPLTPMGVTPIWVMRAKWNSQGKLTQMDWLPASVTARKNSKKNSQTRFKKNAFNSDLQDNLQGTLFPLDSSKQVPLLLHSLFEKLKNYFYSGEPLGKMPWELIDTSRWSAFQKEVYQALLEIPHGETRTYSWVAKRVRRGLATRAVGQALRKNPLPILIPCHRVVAEDSLGGFMGSANPEDLALQFKSGLIELEGCYLHPKFPFI